MKPTIAVTGATGKQGGSVVRFLIADGGYQIRALTRDVGSQRAQGVLVDLLFYVGIDWLWFLPFIRRLGRERCRSCQSGLR